MAEEKQPIPIDQNMNTDDLSVLRMLLHTIKGLSPVSTTVDYTLGDEVDD
jgi:hypothetical protein